MITYIIYTIIITIFYKIIRKYLVVGNKANLNHDLKDKVNNIIFTKKKGNNNNRIIRWNRIRNSIRIRKYGRTYNISM
jgi:hypothetical protein